MELNDRLMEQTKAKIESNKKLQDDNQAANLHQQTMNMMTKYQLVFIKLETTLHKISKNIVERNKMRQRKGLMAFKRNARLSEKQVAKKQILVALKLKHQLGKAFGHVEARREAFLRMAFERIVTRAAAGKQGQAIKKAVGSEEMKQQ
jgi:phosphoenolpyruvate carboxylase